MPPRRLTPLQVEATQLFFSMPQSAGFAVAGGAALIVQGLIQRQTRDVDLFLLDATASTITSAAASFETAIGERGWSHQRVIDQLLDWAADDDPGFDNQIFADMLASIERLSDEDLPVQARRASELRAYFRDWAAELAAH
jgi:hypothetical protein